MAQSGVSYPEVSPFTYVLIPWDESKDVVELLFDGHSEEVLRGRLTRHFRQVLLSSDQMKVMSRHLVEKSNEAAKLNAARTSATEYKEATSIDPVQQKQMIDSYLEQSSYEIIPITMPTRTTKFVGTSLYIDDCGNFKDLSMNYRASRIAQREIRGDAFILANHDDPALDVWRRVDCTLRDYHSLHAEPPVTQYDASDRAQMAQAATLREEETKKINSDDIRQAKTAKEDGNRYVAAGDFKAAVQAYSVAVTHTEGRRDLLPDEAEATTLHKSVLLNRSMCFCRLGEYLDAVKDANKAILLDSTNPKAYYRLAQALIGSKDYAEARKALQGFSAHGGSSADAAMILASIKQGECATKEILRKKLAGMFE